MSEYSLFGYWDEDYNKFVSIEIGNDLNSFAPDQFNLIPLYRKDEG